METNAKSLGFNGNPWFEIYVFHSDFINQTHVRFRAVIKHGVFNESPIRKRNPISIRRNTFGRVNVKLSLNSQKLSQYQNANNGFILSVLTKSVKFDE